MGYEDKVKEKLLKDASELKLCRNCALGRFTSYEEYGHCQYSKPGKPIGVPKVIHEHSTCDHWKSMIKKGKKDAPRKR